jgi:phosphatidylcholine synthase
MGDFASGSAIALDLPSSDDDSGSGMLRLVTRVLFAWAVHLITASGAVIGVLALLAVAQGDLPRAALLMLAALAIDSVDGTLARAFGVAEVLPGFDGRRLDDLVDYLNYVIVPAVFLVASDTLPGWGWVALPVLASAYGFSQREAKTDDDFFLGFPSYWNVVAIYLWQLDLSPALSAAIVAGLAFAVFVPLKYVYPSQMSTLRRTTNAGAALWLLAVSAAIIWPGPLTEIRLMEITLLYPFYYIAISLWLGGWHRKAPRRAP